MFIVKLTSSQLELLEYFCRYRDRATGVDPWLVWDNRDIGDALGYAKNTMSAALTKLTSLGLAEVQTKGAGTIRTHARITEAGIQRLNAFKPTPEEQPAAESSEAERTLRRIYADIYSFASLHIGTLPAPPMDPSLGDIEGSMRTFLKEISSALLERTVAEGYVIAAGECTPVVLPQGGKCGVSVEIHPGFEPVTGSVTHDEAVRIFRDSLDPTVTSWAVTITPVRHGAEEEAAQ